MNNDSNERITEQQNHVQGQQKEVNVKNYPKVIELANILKNVYYPTDKSTINPNPNISQLLEKFENKLYNNSSEVVSSTGLINHLDNSYQLAIVLLV